MENMKMKVSRFNVENGSQKIGEVLFNVLVIKK